MLKKIFLPGASSWRFRSTARNFSAETGNASPEKQPLVETKEKPPPLFQPIPTGKFDKELEPQDDDDDGKVSTYNEELGEYYGPRGKEPTRSACICFTNP